MQFTAGKLFHRHFQGLLCLDYREPRFDLVLIDTLLLARLRYVALEQKLAHDRFAALYPGDQKAANSAFLSFAGMLGQVRRPVCMLVLEAPCRLGVPVMI